jgi:hypothetical protein
MIPIKEARREGRIIKLENIPVTMGAGEQLTVSIMHLGVLTTSGDY